MNRSISAGVVLAAAWVALSALRDIAVRETDVRAPALAFIGFLLIAVGYNATKLLSSATARGELSSAYHPGVRRVLYKLNVSTALSWLPAFLALKYIAASTFAPTAVAAIPMVSLALERRNGTRLTPLRQDIGVVLAIATGVAVVVISELMQQDASTRETELLGVGLALVVSVFAAANNVYSVQLNRANISPSAVFASRFWLCLLGALVWSIASGEGTLPTSADGWLMAASIALFGIGLSTFALQHGLARAKGAYVIGLVVASYPVVVLLLRIGEMTSSVLILRCIGVATLATGIVIGLRRETQK